MNGTVIGYRRIKVSIPIYRNCNVVMCATVSMTQGPHSVSLRSILGVHVPGFLGILEILPGKPYLIQSSSSIKIGVKQQPISIY